MEPPLPPCLGSWTPYSNLIALGDIVYEPILLYYGVCRSGIVFCVDGYYSRCLLMKECHADHSLELPFSRVPSPLLSLLTNGNPFDGGWLCDILIYFRANFVYFGMKLNSAKGAREKEIVDYAFQVLGEPIRLMRSIIITIIYQWDVCFWGVFYSSFAICTAILGRRAREGNPPPIQGDIIFGNPGDTIPWDKYIDLSIGKYTKNCFYDWSLLMKLNCACKTLCRKWQPRFLKASEITKPFQNILNSDAIGVVHGPGHMEVKYTTTGPCLVEVGTRCHGGEGTWQAIADECLGYNQVILSAWSWNPE